MNYISFRGVSTATMTNVEVARMPAHKKAAVRYTEYTIPGRDGSVHIDEGYAPFEMIAYLIVWGGGAATRQTINAWADGTGKLYTSDQPTLCWEASVLKEVEWTRDEFANGVFFDTAKVVFLCQPFMRETTDRIITVTEDQSIQNIGNTVSRPLIKVYGSGDVDFTIDGNTIEIDGMQSAHPVTIDSETGYVYTDTGAAVMTGEIPTFKINQTGLTLIQITLGSGVTKLEINPRWGWV